MNREDIRIYIDETHHLHSNTSPMVLGGVWGNVEALKSFSRKVKVVRAQNGIPTNRELKWTKVSPSKLSYYIDIVKLFLSEEGINYRAVIVDKDIIDNRTFGQTDDDFYYRMQYQVVKHVAQRHSANFYLFFDYKDTRSNYYCQKTADILNNTKSLIGDGDHFFAQLVQSYESIPLQIVDLLNGLIAFANSKDKKKSRAKRKLVDEFKKISKINIAASSPYAADKVNLLFWQPKEK